MKKKFSLNFILLSFFAILIIGCKKNDVDPPVTLKIIADNPSEVLRTSTVLRAKVVGTTLGENVKYGFEISTHPNMDYAVDYPYKGEIENGIIHLQISDLTKGEKYYFVAYAIDKKNITKSDIQSFNTPNTSGAYINQMEVANFDLLEFSAAVEDDGGIEIKEAGFCWSINGTPIRTKGKYIPGEIKYDKITGIISSVEPQTTYLVRAYSVYKQGNEEIVTYSNETISFKTPEITQIIIEDENFRKYILSNFDRDGNGEISKYEALSIYHINISTENISSLSGIESFINLTSLYAAGVYNMDNNTYKGELKSIDLSKNYKLTTLNIYGNKLTKLDLSQNIALNLVRCNNNELETIDLPQYSNLAFFYCQDNLLTTLNISQNKLLKHLYCTNNPMNIIYVWDDFDASNYKYFYKGEQAEYKAKKQ